MSLSDHAARQQTLPLLNLFPFARPLRNLELVRGEPVEPWTGLEYRGVQRG